MFFQYPGQTIDMLEKDLNNIVKFNFPHISYYSCRADEDIDTIYHDKNQLEEENNLEASMLKTIQSKLQSNGYTQYEINHFVKGNKRSYHNSKYWNLEEYIGVGLGASGLVENRLYKNYIDFENYFNSIRSDKRPTMEKEDLTAEEMEKNYIISRMGLREGLNIDYVNKKYGINFLEKYKDQIAKYLREDIIEQDGKYIKFTDNGIYKSNRFFVDII